MEGALEKILPSVARPARYIAGEYNSVEKDLNKTDVKIALCFPDIYEVGMSHLGSRILYSLLNERDDIACERVFAAWVDMEEIMRKENMPLYSLESKRPVREFDMIGFSLTYDMSYTNVVNMLDMAGIPKFSRERTSHGPIVMAGGPCTCNPEPVSDYFDFFIIGEAEEVIFEVIAVFKKYKKDKVKFLENIAGIEGVYVPQFYKPDYDSGGTLIATRPIYPRAGSKIKRRIIKDLNNCFYPKKFIVPYIQIIHDRIMIEIMRGCPNSCNFCQASSAYRPVRLRSKDAIIDLAKENFKNTGYEEISLVSLSSGNHPAIKEIVSDLVAFFKDKGVGISLPSLRAEDIVALLPSLISEIHKTGLTFAPEAGTRRLRSAINKDIDMENLFRAVQEASRHGWRRVKLYFMIGLPTETDEDLLGIKDTVEKLKSISNKLEITVSAAYFIPKPHTAYEREAMEQKNALLAKGNMLKKILDIKGVKLKLHNIDASFLEAVFSRGDRRLSEVIFRAWSAGARFDAWSEHFRFDIWLDAFKSCGIDPSYYANRRIPPEEALPWDHIAI